MLSFSADQTYIVTGASSGIGESVSLLLNKLGATVVGIGRDQGRLNKLVESAPRPELMHIELKDLSADVGSLPTYIKELREKFGKFSGAVCSAGVTAVSPARMYDLEYVKRVFDINYFSPLFLVKGLIDKRNIVGRGTSIVCLSSIDAIISTKGQSVYSGTKAALSASMKAIAREVAPQGVRINCLQPSMIRTPMTTNMGDADIGAEINAECDYPFGWGSPTDVANFAVFLLSDKTRWITGQNYVVDCARF